jgi:hypothetical protein
MRLTRSGPVSLFIGTVGAISVFKAVYIDKPKLKSACVGVLVTSPLVLHRLPKIYL